MVTVYVIAYSVGSVVQDAVAPRKRVNIREVPLEWCRGGPRGTNCKPVALSIDKIVFKSSDRIVFAQARLSLLRARQKPTPSYAAVWKRNETWMPDPDFSRTKTSSTDNLFIYFFFFSAKSLFETSQHLSFKIKTH